MSGEVFVLIYQENSDNRCDADVFVFGDLDRAQEKMYECYGESLRNLGHNVDERKDDYYCWVADKGAAIVEGCDSYHWRIETQEIL